MKTYVFQIEINLPKNGWLYGCFICSNITSRTLPLETGIFLNFKKKILDQFPDTYTEAEITPSTVCAAICPECQREMKTNHKNIIQEYYTNCLNYIKTITNPKLCPM